MGAESCVNLSLVQIGFRIFFLVRQPCSFGNMRFTYPVQARWKTNYNCILCTRRSYPLARRYDFKGRKNHGPEISSIIRFWHLHYPVDSWNRSTKLQTRHKKRIAVRSCPLSLSCLFMPVCLRLTRHKDCQKDPRKREDTYNLPAAIMKSSEITKE